MPGSAAPDGPKAAPCAGVAWAAGALVRVSGRHGAGRGTARARAWRRGGGGRCLVANAAWAWRVGGSGRALAMKASAIARPWCLVQAVVGWSAGIGPLARWRGSVAALCQRRRQRTGQRNRAQKDAARLGCPRCLLGCQRRAARGWWAGRASRLGVVATVARPPQQSADRSARPAEPPRQRAGLPPPRAGVAATDWKQGVYPLHPRARASLAGRRCWEQRCPARASPAAACPAATTRARSKAGARAGAASRSRVRWSA